MDIRELIMKLKTIRVWTTNGSNARQLLDDLIYRLQSQVPQ